MADSATIEATTRDVVQELVRGFRMFTALDVSNEVKERISGVRHREISPVVRALYEADVMGSDYAKSTIDVDIGGGRKAQALLYHPDGDDPSNYGDRSQRAASPGRPSSPAPSPSPSPGSGGGGSFRGPLGTSSSPAPAAPAPTSTPAPAPAPSASSSIGDSIKLTIASDGSAAVPVALLERAGIDSDTVALDVAGMGSAITLSDPEWADDPLDELDVGAVVRVPASYMGAFGGDTVYARVDGDRVTIDR